MTLLSEIKKRLQRDEEQERQREERRLARLTRKEEADKARHEIRQARLKRKLEHERLLGQVKKAEKERKKTATEIRKVAPGFNLSFLFGRKAKPKRKRRITAK